MNSTVTIVEDDNWLAEHYRRIIEKAGFRVTTARHASEAIDVIDQTEPDAIVLDMLLGGGTGIALLNELQSHDDLAKIPVIVATAVAENVALTELEPYGVRIVLDKTTMHPDDVVTALRRALL